MTTPPLPEVIPVFPLTGVLLLPGMVLPLHLFEPRYRNMAADAIGGNAAIGMVQPLIPAKDNRPDLQRPPDAPEFPAENPVLYPVGCLGRVESWEQMPDGRYTIALKGISRFRIREELPLQNGYRRVVAAYGEYPDDETESDAEFDAAPLLAALERWMKDRNSPLDLEKLREMPGIATLNGLAMALPLAPVERQALLEAPALSERERLLLDLLGMGLRGRDEGEDATPPKVN